MISKYSYSILLFVLIGFYQQAFAYYRHCEAQVNVRFGGTQPLHILNYTGKGGDDILNHARNIARDWIGRCGFDLWNKRWELVGSRDTADLPSSCRNFNVFGFYPNEVDIKGNIARQVCDTWGYFLNPPHNRENIPVVVYLRSSGDRGCGNRRDRTYTWIMSHDYKVTKQMCAQGY